MINNHINFNIESKNVNSEFIKYNNNNVYKKNKVTGMKYKNYININRNSVNGLNETFYKTHLYNKTLDIDSAKKRF